MDENQALEGGCACGAVRYTVAAEPTFSFHCQCRQCQRASGGGHASAFVVPAQAVDVQGEIRFFDQTSDKGNTVSRGFCPNCGSPLLNRNDGHPDSVFICAASLDEPSLFRPSTVLFKEAAQPWDYVDPALS